MGLITMVVAVSLQIIAMQPPSPKPESAPANEFSAARALVQAEYLLDDGAPHPIGTEANAKMRNRIVSELDSLGYPVETQATFVCSTIWSVCGQVHNVLTRLPGSSARPAVLLTAHYDSVPAGPGAADDVASVAVILEIARILSAEAPLGNPIIFLLSDGEEPGLLGAEAFLTEHPWAAEVGIVINLEARGTSGQSILFETTENNSWLIDAFVTHAPRPIVSSVYDEIYKYQPNNTDLTIYETAGIPGVNFAFFEDFAHYHTPLDNLANLDPGSVQHQGDNALATVRAFGDLDLLHPPAGNSVSLDLLPGVILRWPEPWTFWLALACLLVWSGLAVVLIRRGELPVRALLWGSVVFPVGVLGASVLGLALVVAIGRLAGSPEPWYAYPLPVRAAIWAGALFSLALTATAVARRAGYWGLSLGVWLWWALLSLLLAWSVPGISVIFLVPTGLALFLLTGVGLTKLRLSSGTREIAALIGLFGASSLWLAFALQTESGAGLELGLVAGFAVGLAASALAALLALPENQGHVRRWWLVGTGIAVLVAAAIASWVPAYIEFRPQRLNLLHYEARHLGEAYWLMEDPAPSGSSAGSAHETAARAGDFGEPRAILPWSGRRYLVSPAAPTTMPAPELQLLTDDHIAGERVVQLQLQSSRGGNQVTLHIPEAAGLKRIDILETSFTLEEISVENGYQTFDCFGPACSGLRLALHLESNASFVVMIVDSTPGLPPGSEAIIEARPTIAAPSDEGDATLIADQVWVEPP
jgi:hypothetical protein